MIKTKTKLKSEIASKKELIEKPKFSKGSLYDIQEAIKNIYTKLDDLNERIK